MESASCGIYNYTLFAFVSEIKRVAGRSKRVRFLIRQELVRKYHTPALSKKYSLFIKQEKYTVHNMMILIDPVVHYLFNCSVQAQLPYTFCIWKTFDFSFSKTRYWVKACAVLTCLLGTTWLLGVFFFGKSSVVMAYLFNIFNVLQVTNNIPYRTKKKPPL